jgi:Tfp pilus assembly protein PilF
MKKETLAFRSALPFVFAAFVLALSGCSPLAMEFQDRLEGLLVLLAKANVPGISPRYRAQALLDVGLSQYEQGEYLDSEESLEAALAAGLALHDEVTARKHLAFMHCIAEREYACRSEFQKALAADPAMNLEAAEAGHPAWGPVFTALKTSH